MLGTWNSWWYEKICGDSVALRPAVDKEYSRLLEIIEKRKTDLKELGKASLEECFLTNKSNQDKDLQKSPWNRLVESRMRPNQPGFCWITA